MYTAVEQPVAAEHAVLVRRTRDVCARPAGRARQEANRLEPGLESRAREDRRAEQAFDQHARRVVREYRDRVRPQRRLLPVARDEAFVETLDERIARVELIDADPTLELVEAHQVEHERSTHDPRRIPAELVERVAQQSLRREHAVAHVYERVGFHAAQVVEVRRRGSPGSGSRSRPRRCSRRAAGTPGGRSGSTPRRSVRSRSAPRRVRGRAASTTRRRARRRHRSHRCRAGSSSRPAAARCRTN